MKMINTETSQFTTIKRNEFGGHEYQEAADRLAARVKPGHFAGSLSHYNLEDRNTTEFDVEILRTAGDLTEHTGEKLYLRIERTKDPAAIALGRKGGKAKSEKKTAAVRKNARKGGRPKLTYEFDGEWNQTRIFSGPKGWKIEFDRQIQGEYTGRAIFVPYSADFPQGQDLDADWNDHTSYASALIHQCEDLKGSKILRKGHLVQ